MRQTYVCDRCGEEKHHTEVDIYYIENAGDHFLCGQCAPERHEKRDNWHCIAPDFDKENAHD